MTLNVTGRLGGQYMLLATEDGKYKVQGNTPQTSGVHTLFSGEYEVASRVLDYCQQHDGLAQQAIQDLFYKGDPTMMIQLVEAAKQDPTVKGRKRVALFVNIETDVLEDEDAITLVSQRTSAALRMSGVTVRSLECSYVGQTQPEPAAVGLEYCAQQIERALAGLDPKRLATSFGTAQMEAVRAALFPETFHPESKPFDLEAGTGNARD